MSATQPPGPAGVPAGLLSATLEVLRLAKGPIRRRAVLRELETRGHRVSLAGLNRALDHTSRTGVTRDTPDGVVLVSAESRR
jgi:hypothetical protein